jgi:hypothetical protein
VGNENATRAISSCGLVCYLMSTKVYTYVDFPSLPRGGGWDGVNDVRDCWRDPPNLG